jgi:tetratricopeptide (TPR) repeat protein
MRCLICDRRKGKRGCKINGGQFICSQCCGSVRNDNCEGCSYYATSLQSQRKRRIADKKFITEIIPEVDERCNEALALVEKGKIAKGQAILEHLHREHPNYHVVLYGLGVCHGLQEHTEEAISCFKQAIEVFPIFTEAYYNLATTYCQKVDIPNAVEALETVIELDGEHGPSGQLARKRLNDFERMTRKSPGISLAAYVQNQRIYDKAFSALKNRQFRTAIRLFNRVLSVDKNSVQSWGNIGLAYAGIGDKNKALECLDKAVSIDPTYEPAIYNRLAVEKMEDGESLPNMRLRDINYYLDYRKDGKRSYAAEMLEKLQEKVTVQSRG